MKDLFSKARTRWAALMLMAALAMGLLQVSPVRADTTTITFVVGSGALSVDNAETSVSLGNVSHNVAGSTVSGSVGNITVSDLRNLTLGWAVTGSTTDFTHTNGTDKVLKAGATITQDSTLVSATGINSGGFVGGVATGAGGVIATAVAVTGVIGSNSATFAPTMSIVVPTGTPTGTYSGTFTTTVV